ncbi:5686_t:CDS:2, partial [Racocetra persica]
MTRIEITEKHSSNNKRDAPGKQEVIRYRKLVAWIFGLEKTVKKLERDVAFLETELEDLDDCVNKSTVVDLIYEIVLTHINKKEQKAVPYKQRRK